jgi:TPP-dependent 2-oxoacid decarboxylase
MLPDTTLTPDIFWAGLARHLQPRDIIFADQGTAFFGGLGVRLPFGAELIGQPMWASIGYTRPALLGAQLADPSRRALVVIGDGAAQMTIQELGTFFRHDLKPLVFILNNRGYTIERAIHNPNARYHDIANWEWSRIPAAFGADERVLTMRVWTASELDAVLITAANERRMAVVEVHMNVGDRPEFLDRFVAAVRST